MIWYFNDTGRLVLLRSALARWQHTPFCEGVAVVGRGVDCVGLAREVYRSCGVDVSSVDRIPRYSLSYGIHHRHTPLLAWLHDDEQVRQQFRRMDAEAEPLGGDLWFARAAQGVHHVAMVGGERRPRIWHVPVGGSVSGMDQAGFLRLCRVVVRLRLKEVA